MPKMERPADVLNGAADIIERDGWCQGPPQPGLGPVCAGVAIMRSTRSVSLQVAAQQKLQSVTHCWSPSRWNDEPGRTKAEVVSALRTAATLS